MDFEKIKREEDTKKSVSESLEKIDLGHRIFLRKIDEYENLKEHIDIKEEMKSSLEMGFKEFFISQEFEISEKTPTIIASYNTYKVHLTIDNDFYIFSTPDIKYLIKIEESKRMRYFNKFQGILFDNKLKFFNINMESIDAINEQLRFLDQDILHYSTRIDHPSEIEFVYQVYDDHADELENHGYTDINELLEFLTED